MRWFLLVYILVFLGAAFLYRSYMLWKHTGINPYMLGNTDSVHDYIGQLFRFTIVAQVVIVLLYAFWSDAYVYLIQIPWLESYLLVATGIVLLMASLIWVVIAQMHMGNAWRIGIDTTRKTQLVEHGVFCRSRNPIFLGMRGMSFGLFLIIPNAMTLVTFLLAETLIHIQVRLEEEHLSKLHGEQYTQYQQRTPRWL